jgi:hypothetical protein
LLPKSKDKVAMAIVGAVLAIVIAAALYIFVPRTLVIDDISRAQTYRIASGAEDQDIYSIEVSGSGEFQGTVKLELIAPAGNVIEQVTLENDGDFEWKGDWYASEAQIRVTPGSAQAGEIRLHYRFVGFL